MSHITGLYARLMLCINSYLCDHKSIWAIHTIFNVIISPFLLCMANSSNNWCLLKSAHNLMTIHYMFIEWRLWVCWKILETILMRNYRFLTIRISIDEAKKLKGIFEFQNVMEIVQSTHKIFSMMQLMSSVLHINNPIKMISRQCSSFTNALTLSISKNN